MEVHGESSHTDVMAVGRSELIDYYLMYSVVPNLIFKSLERTNNHDRRGDGQFLYGPKVSKPNDSIFPARCGVSRSLISKPFFNVNSVDRE